MKSQLNLNELRALPETGMLDQDELQVKVDGGIAQVFVNKSTGALHLFRPSSLDSVQRQLYATLDEYESIQKMHSKIDAQSLTPCATLVERGDHLAERCDPCSGTGQVWALIGQMESLAECTACNGEGKI